MPTQHPRCPSTPISERPHPEGAPTPPTKGLIDSLSWSEQNWRWQWGFSLSPDGSRAQRWGNTWPGPHIPPCITDRAPIAWSSVSCPHCTVRRCFVPPCAHCMEFYPYCIKVFPTVWCIGTSFPLSGALSPLHGTLSLLHWGLIPAVQCIGALSLLCEALSSCTGLFPRCKKLCPCCIHVLSSVWCTGASSPLSGALSPLHWCFIPIEWSFVPTAQKLIPNASHLCFCAHCMMLCLHCTELCPHRTDANPKNSSWGQQCPRPTCCWGARRAASPTSLRSSWDLGLFGCWSLWKPFCKRRSMERCLRCREE